MKDVALVDALVVDAHALVVDAVRRAEILDVERAVATDDGGVLARDVAVLDRQVRRLAAAPDDELVLGHRVSLPVVDQEQRRTGAHRHRRSAGRRCSLMLHRAHPSRNTRRRTCTRAHVDVIRTLVPRRRRLGAATRRRHRTRGLRRRLRTGLTAHSIAAHLRRAWIRSRATCVVWWTDSLGALRGRTAGRLRTGLTAHSIAAHLRRAWIRS